MSTTNDIRKMSAIQDENTYIEEDDVQHSSYKGKVCKSFRTKLTYHAKMCSHCQMGAKGTSVFANVSYNDTNSRNL